VPQVHEEERRGDILFVQLRDYETDREFSLGLRSSCQNPSKQKSPFRNTDVLPFLPTTQFFLVSGATAR